jgi:hypothetical protein
LDQTAGYEQLRKAKEETTTKPKTEALIKEYGVKLPGITDEARRFTALYIQKKAIPPARHD